MWTRASLKEKAKTALSANYWRIILVTLIVFVIGGASSNVGLNIDSDEIGAAFENGFMKGFSGGNSIQDELGFGEEFYYNDDAMGYGEEFYYNDDELGYGEEFYYDNELIESVTSMGIAILFGVILVVVVIAFIIGFFLSVFIYCPLEVGTKRFFFNSLNRPAEVKEVAFAFDNNYKNVVKILFFRELYLLGWSLLFVIPGIVKSYEYLMVPYLLAENPNLTKEQAFTLSKQMMMGHKWDAFVLDLSFLGWDILSGFTMGILSIFYVEPYKCLTYAALYEELSLINGRPAAAMQQDAYTTENPYGDTMSQQMYEEPVEESISEE